jgi:CRP-like cAMP-binding protein
VADINTLARIFLNLEPVKRIKNFSTIYHICRCMFLAKFREKTFVYQRQEEAECLYLVLNGKVGLYKRQVDIDDQEDVIFLSEGNCFGSAYNWKQKFLPLTFEETLVAVVPRREVGKLTVSVLQEREEMLKTVRKAKIFDEGIPEETLRAASQFFTLHRLPFGTFLIKEGEIPKAIYYLLKGSVRKQLPMSEQGERQ